MSLMREPIQELILNALLDKYERSSFFQEEKALTRRIMLNLYNEGRSDFPYYDIEQSDRRISVNRAVTALAENNLVFYDWMKGERDHLIAKVWLNVDNMSAAYQAARREPKGDLLARVCKEIQETLSQVNSPWACSFLRETYEQTVSKRRVTGALPSDDGERGLLLRAIAAADKLEGNEFVERVFSLRTFGDTKTFERTVRSRLLGILRKYLDNDDDTNDEDVLKQIGIVKYPEQLEFCGNIALAVDNRLVDFACLPSGGAIFSPDVARGTIVIAPSVERVITIENKANYIDYIHKTKSENDLVIYHGGQYSPRKRTFLQKTAQALPENCRWDHWSDIDYGGFIMLARLRREICAKVMPYRMNAGELKRYTGYTVAIKAKYAEKLQSLKNREELADCRDCIDYMLENMVRLEQEAMLTDVE